MMELHHWVNSSSFGVATYISGFWTSIIINILTLNLHSLDGIAQLGKLLILWHGYLYQRLLDLNYD